jgi:adenine-specific DNA-methyltransferase
MRGFVPTPEAIVDQMVGKLFQVNPPQKRSRILDPGCGEGVFIDGVIRWCESRGLAIPHITGVENHPGRAKTAGDKYKKYRSISIECRDFLVDGKSQYDYVIGNPPYVSILQLSEQERTEYRDRYESARGRFDLYMLFFEQSLWDLKPDGRLVFITPEKYLYVKTCEALRKFLTSKSLVEVTLVAEDAFKGLVTYPTITVIDKSKPGNLTTFTDRKGASKQISLPSNGASFLPMMANQGDFASSRTLEDICLRVSCGVATGADDVFVRASAGLPRAIRRFAHPTVSGRQLYPDKHPVPQEVMLIPYDKTGTLLDESRLGELATALAPSKKILLNRVCSKRKPWYAFHDSVPFDEMLRPKILCKDITKDPNFWADYEGSVVPRHSVYYIVPKDPETLDVLLEYFNSPSAQTWLRDNCQHAANGFLRMQSAVLKQLPIPDDLFQRKGRKKSAHEQTAA